MKGKLGFTEVAIGFAALFLVACSDGGGASSPTESAEKKAEVVAVPVEVAQVQRGDISAVYSSTTSLEAEQEAVVVAKSSEIITQILVEEGDKVEKGQVLARLNTQKLELELKRSEANLARLKAELDRNRKIFEKKMVSSDTYERLKFDYQAQKAAYDLAKLELAYGEIKAPIEGVVSERMVKVGNMVQLNQSLFRITDFEPLLAVIHVPENELFKLQKNQLARISIDANKQTLYNGHVLRISPVVDSSSGTFKVTVEVNDPENTLRPGMFGRVGVIYASHKDTLLVHKNALLAEEDKPSVYRIDGDVAVKEQIAIGFENGEFIEVIEGLKLGDKVVTAGQNSLKNLSKVDVLNEPLSQTEYAKLTER
ncbi:MAG: efflux RND transporter periplasmic adaptor subunit [Gammaproteobacteria bacterium]|nr:efflux RND transporter periplasmic adaptor subunit [Gammaproteobacteria bacterium]